MYKIIKSFALTRKEIQQLSAFGDVTPIVHLIRDNDKPCILFYTTQQAEIILTAEVFCQTVGVNMSIIY